MAAAVARAVRENPHVNARVLDDSYVVFKDINLGVAVDSPDDLSGATFATLRRRMK